MAGSTGWGLVEADTSTGEIFEGPHQDKQLSASTVVVVDEAGMLDQDTARAVTELVEEHGASLVMVGDRAQLPAVGRGGVLDTAVQAVGENVVDMATVHRFADSPTKNTQTCRSSCGTGRIQLNYSKLFTGAETLFCTPTRKQLLQR
ncbi:AAA family ATPase [Renibacterium salmoninarum]|uniref:AAA family ATPase n=1 Tax=Renibacterium salmoninarum TaxID=1646 RepID=UPI0002E890AD|nr:AAA family ATPase [Renibacterium salmoninarum]